MPVNQIRLVHKGKALLDTKTLLDYGIGQGEVVHLLKKLGTDDPNNASLSSSLQASTSVPSTQSQSTASMNSQEKSESDNPLEQVITVGNDASFWSDVSTYLKTRFNDGGHPGIGMNASANLVCARIRESVVSLILEYLC